MARKKKEPVVYGPMTKKESVAQYKNKRNTTKFGSLAERNAKLKTQRSALVASRKKRLEVNTNRVVNSKYKPTKPGVDAKAIRANAEKNVNRGLSNVTSPISSGITQIQNINGNGSRMQDSIRRQTKEKIKGSRDARIAKVLEKRGGKMTGTQKALTKGKKVVAGMKRLDVASGKYKFKKRYKALGVVGAYAAYRTLKNKKKEEGR